MCQNVIYRVLNVFYMLFEIIKRLNSRTTSHLSQRDRAHGRLHEVWSFLVVDLPRISDLYVSIATSERRMRAHSDPTYGRPDVEGWV